MPHRTGLLKVSIMLKFKSSWVEYGSRIHVTSPSTSVDISRLLSRTDLRGLVLNFNLSGEEDGAQPGSGPGSRLSYSLILKVGACEEALRGEASKVKSESV